MDPRPMYLLWYCTNKQISQARSVSKKTVDRLKLIWSYRLRRCLLLAALVCVLRPTNILIWICLACFILFRPRACKERPSHQPSSLIKSIKGRLQKFLQAPRTEAILLIREASLCGYVTHRRGHWHICFGGFTNSNRTLVLALSAAFDRLYYQQWTFPPLRFLYFNIARSLAVIYGRNDWHYYWSQGYPLLLTTFLPFAIRGLYNALFPATSISPSSGNSQFSNSIRCQLATVAIFVPSILSVVSHKEVRFIYPILPILHILAASSVVGIFLPAIAFRRSWQLKRQNFYRRLAFSQILAINLFIAIFTSRYHQTGPLTVLTYLREEYTQKYLGQPPLSLFPVESATTMTVGFLMPCHSTPWRSHLVFPGIKAWALGCEPPVDLNATARATYLDEADQFYAGPTAFLDMNLGKPPQRSTQLNPKTPRQSRGLTGRAEDWAWDGKPGKKIWPDYLVFFAQLEPTMGATLNSTDYHPCWRGWNSFFHDDWRRKGRIVVWCLNSKISGPQSES